MNQTSTILKIVSLLALPIALAIAYGLDRILEYQKKLAAATFDYLPSVMWMLVAGLFLFGLWFALGWIVLSWNRGSQLVGGAYLVTGLLILILPPIHLLTGIQGGFSLLPVSWLRILYADTVRFSSAFVATIGLLSLLPKFRFRGDI